MVTKEKFYAKVICPPCHEIGYVRRKVEKHTEKTREDSIMGAVHREEDVSLRR